LSLQIDTDGIHIVEEVWCYNATKLTDYGFLDSTEKCIFVRIMRTLDA